MVDFNPQLPATSQVDWTGVSRGTGVDRSFEALFGGLAETVQGAIVAKDQQTQQEIEDQARAGFEEVNTEFGFDPPPPGMQGELDRIVSLQNALQQGKISQVNYYGRLATLSKQLRTKYPRYENIVDSTIQSVTGTRPANAYRDALWSEMSEMANSATNEEKFQRDYIKQNQDTIAAVFGPEFFDNPEQYPFELIQKEVARFGSETMKMDRELKELDVMSKTESVNSTRVSKVASGHFSFMVTSELEKASGVNGLNFQQRAQEFIQSGGENLDQFMIDMAAGETTLRNQLFQYGQREFVAKGLMSSEDLNKQIDQAMTPFTKTKELLLGGNFEFATRMTTVNKDIRERALNDIFQKYPEAHIGAGLSELNPYAGASWLENSGVLDQIGNAALEITGQAASGNAGGIIGDTVRSGDQRVSRQVIDNSLNVLTDPNVKPEHVTRVINELFGPGIDFMSSEIVDASDLEAVYTKFLDPRVTAAIREKGTPEDFQRYTEWAIDKFRALPNVRTIAGDVNKALGGIDPEDVEIAYDPAKNRIDLKVADSVLQSLPGSFNVARPLLRQFVGTMNKALSVLDPIAEAQGVPMEELVSDLLGEMNREAEGASDGGFFKFLQDRLSPEGLLGYSPSEQTSSIGEELSEDTELDFLFEQRFEEVGRGPTPTNESRVADASDRNLLDMIGVAEGAGYNTLYGQSQRRYGVTPTNMTIAEVQKLQRTMAGQLGSSAFGKYQIMAATLRDAIRAMGLTPDMKFTPELQDRIALEYLLPRRGYNEWKSGKLSNKAFLTNLSQEWAAIPTSQGGASFYHGDRMGNKSTRGGQAIARMIGG